MHRALITGLFLLAGFSSGCWGGGSEVETATLTGEIKRTSGDPISDVTVVLYPAKGPSAVTKTDAAGRFTIDVAVGDARVAVVPKAEATSSDMTPKALADLKKEKSPIKRIYSSPDTSGLTVKVTPEQAEKVVLVVE